MDSKPKTIKHKTRNNNKTTIIKPIIIIKHNTHIYIYIRVQGGFREG